MLKSTYLLPLFGIFSIAPLGLGCGSSDTTGGGGSSSSTTTGPATTAATTGSGTSSGGGGAGTGTSSGGGGSGPDMSPIKAPNEAWTFVPITGSRCMNNTATGIGVNLTNASDDVVIYMEGGNACFNEASCLETYNLDGYGQKEFDGDATSVLTEPLFDRQSSLLKDYNYVYIPYCTGDTHAGDNETMVAGTMRYFHGANNMELYLDRLVATFPKAKNIILSGSSAGGFGAAFNYDRVAKAFPQVKVMLLDDSGPPMGVDFVPACLQKAFMQTWGLDKTLPKGCTDCVTSSGIFMEPFISYVAKTYSDRKLALISSTQDGTISKFWGYGDMNCTGLAGLPPPYLGTEYAMGLQDLRDRILAGTNFKMFLIDGTNGEDNTHHVWLDVDPSTVQSNDVKLSDWLDAMINDKGTWSNVPESGI